MCFNVNRESKILSKISEFTVIILLIKREFLCVLVSSFCGNVYDGLFSNDPFLVPWFCVWSMIKHFFHKHLSFQVGVVI